MYVIDLHILHTPESDQRLLTNALASAKEAIANSPVPVALHVLLGSPGNPGIKRYSAYRRGNFEWKSRLDSDDELHPDFFKEVAPYLKQGYERIQTTARVHEPPPRNLIVEGVPKHGGLLIRFDWLERQDGMGLKYAYDILIAENPAKPSS